MAFSGLIRTRGLAASLILLAASSLPAAAAAAGDAPRPAFYGPEDLERAKDRAARLPWARKSVDEIIASADRWLARPAPLPEGPTGWYHDYFCPDHGILLTQDPERPHEHACPVDGRLHRGAKLDAYWTAATIQAQLRTAVQCALAYRFTGRADCARAASAVLLSCAAHYHEKIFPKAPRRWMWQSLDEAVFIINAVKALDLLRGGLSLTAQEEDRILQDWFQPTARFLVTQRTSIHNIHSWYNAAILAIGMASGDGALIDFALGHRDAAGHGLSQQLRDGVSADGFWREGSIGYHFYTLSSIQEQIIPARRLETDLRDELRILKGMYLAPLALADGNWVIPPTNDSGPMCLERLTDHYEVAAGLFPEEPVLAAFLAAAYARSGRERSGLAALFLGPETLPAATGPQTKSRSFPDAGLAVLRTREPHPPTGEVYLLLDFGPHGGGHGHPDKLSVSLHGLGRVLSPDTGTAGYGMALTGSWYRQTLSHNTVVVDRSSQRPATGRLLSFRGEGPLQHVAAQAGDAVPGVDWTRAVFLAEEGYVVVLDRLESQAALGKSHGWDWAWHGFGTLSVKGPALEPLATHSTFGTIDGYEVPSDIQHGAAEGIVEARWSIQADTPTQPEWRRPGTSGTLRLILADEPGTEIFTATAPGNPAKDAVPLIVARRAGTGAFFRAVFEVLPADGTTRIQKIEPVEEGLRVTTASGTRTASFKSLGSDPPPEAPQNVKVK